LQNTELSIDINFKETIINLRDNLHDKLLCEYYEARLLFMLNYYDKALISYNYLLNKIEKRDYMIPDIYFSTLKEKNAEKEKYDKKIEKIKNEILKDMDVIKSILETD